MSNGAPLQSMSFQGREYQCAGDAAGGMKQGGFEGERTPNGNAKTSRNILTPATGRISDQAIEIDIETDDFEYLVALKNGADDIDFVWTYYGDISYGATGSIEGELVYDPMTATASVTIAWDGEARRV